MVTSVTTAQCRQSSTYKQAIFQKVCKSTTESSKQKLPIEAMLWMMVNKVQPTNQKQNKNYSPWNTAQLEWKAEQIIILRCHYLQ